MNKKTLRNLLESAYCSDVEAVVISLKSGCPPDTRDEVHSNMTLLMIACQTDAQAIVGVLLTAGADVNATDRENRTALHYAAMHSNPELISLLLDVGSNINTADEEGWTPLMHAVFWCRDDIVELLLSSGANRDVVTPYHKTVYDIASDMGRNDLGDRIRSW